jgi:hypothetical protein
MLSKLAAKIQKQRTVVKAYVRASRGAAVLRPYTRTCGKVAS